MASSFCAMAIARDVLIDLRISRLIGGLPGQFGG
jgi:hypothetical protein